VLQGVTLAGPQPQLLDMMLSTVLAHSFIPERIADSLGAGTVREVELPQRNSDDGISESEHLRVVYCMNRSGQRRFRVVRIERVDLGVEPAFGPVEALVLDNANSAIGVIGRDWLAQREDGKGYILSAADNTVYFGALVAP
jgi:hypothetical protein